MKRSKTAGYVSVCGMTISLNIVFIMLLAATPLDAMACVLAVVVMTPVIAKFGWRRAVPVYVGTVLLGSLFMDPTLSVLYLCVGFHPFGADTDSCKGGNVRIRQLLRSMAMGAASALLMLGLYQILGLDDTMQGVYVFLVFPMMMIIAFCQGVVYRSAKKLIYIPVVKPLLDSLMDH